MRMKRLILTAAMLAIASLAGCSPTIGAWADRGEIGCANEQTSADAWRDMVIEQIEIQQKSSISDVFADIRAVSSSGITNLDGSPVALDDAWLSEARLALDATLDALAKKRAGVDEMHSRHTSNIAATREAFAQIRRLNTAWAGAGQNSELTAQVAMLITELQKQRTSK